LLSMAERIVDATLRYAKESLTIAFGSVVHHPAQIRDSYAQAVKALDKRFYFQDEHVFLFRQEDFEEVQGGIRWDLTGLLQAIRQGNTERTREATERLFEPFEQQFVSLDYLKHQIMLTVIRLGKLMEEYHGDWDVFYTGKFNEVERIIRHGDIQLLKAFLSRFTKEICSSVESVRQPRKTENRIHEIVELIESRYQSELNLKELSKMFYINAVYLGQLFRKETGEYFNDYINKVRIREACVLLAETNAAAADIAEQVGYKYVDHFYRHFKQIHGMNPGEYRRRLVGG
ncbi:helix-turn-helix domain-containing protein, partial [Paenibacillus sepulcri]|nr:helix-turn-helix domain-containing protein [Paenibacillus sepulcri]